MKEMGSLQRSQVTRAGRFLGSGLGSSSADESGAERLAGTVDDKAGSCATEWWTGDCGVGGCLTAMVMGGDRGCDTREGWGAAEGRADMRGGGE
jgi:hypothetical protein